MRPKNSLFPVFFLISTLAFLSGLGALPAVAGEKKPVKKPAAKRADMTALLTDRFSGNADKQAAAEKKLANLPVTDSLRDAAWQAYKNAPAQQDLRAEFDKKIVATSERTSPYLWRHVGEKPVGGWALVIAMHGGGSGPKEMNDGEWNYMFTTYYKEHPEVSGYVYLALRAPNDTWNGFYDDSICPLTDKLIKEFVLFDGVNPDKVYVMGASHGGYGAFVIGPKTPYRFAAIHAAASAPTDGETMGENLRDVRFTVTVGAMDNGYGRIDRARKFQTQMQDWNKQYDGGYSSAFDFPNTGHLVPDHDKLAEMLKYKRDAAPKFVVWTQSDAVIKRFYWLEAPEPQNKAHIEAKIADNVISIKAANQKKIAIWLDSTLVDRKKPVEVKIEGGKTQTFHLKSSMETYCLGLEQTADPKLTAPSRIEITLSP